MRPMRPRPSANSKSLAGWLGWGRPTGVSGPNSASRIAANCFAIEHVGRLPMSFGIERHVFDEPQLEAALAGEAAERNDFVFGESVNRDGVEPDAFEADFLGGGDAGQHAVEPFAAGDLLKGLFAERIEADVESLEAGAFQVGGLLVEQDAVGRQGEVVDARQRRRAFRPVAAGRARTSGSPPVSRSLVHAHLRDDADEPLDLFER